MSPRSSSTHVSISKALNSIECAAKEKHVCSAITGTFQDSRTFWESVQRLPVLGNRIVAWKFCFVLHRILREGCESVIPESLRHKEWIRNVGKLWCHLRESYGKLIQQYTQLLIVKLDFHRRNPYFPGNLVVSQEDLHSIGGNDVQNYFELAVDMFDYMDKILALQSAIFDAVFGSLEMSNAQTSSVECRVAPLIPCIQDAYLLYDYCVQILFKLHSELPADTLQGHRDRFSRQFKDLKKFYSLATAVKYFRNFWTISIPQLPETEPEFLFQSEFWGFGTPVLRVPTTDREQSEDHVTNLTDTSRRSGTFLNQEGASLASPSAPPLWLFDAPFLKKKTAFFTFYMQR